MAGIGHIAVAVASARLRGEAAPRGRAWSTAGVYAALAMLPDADVLPATVLKLEGDLSAHRGLTHTPLFALAVGVIFFGLILRWTGTWARAARAGLIAALLVGSHGVLDAMAQGGRGILFLWPFSWQRFHFPFRPIPDIPTGLELVSRLGLHQLGIELIVFLPVLAYALGWRALWRTGAARSPPPAGRRVPRWGGQGTIGI